MFGNNKWTTIFGFLAGAAQYAHMSGFHAGHIGGTDYIGLASSIFIAAAGAVAADSASKQPAQPATR